MFILGIDTSAIVCSVALLQDSKILAQRCASEGRTHSEVLLPQTKEILEEAGILPGELDLIAISSGPGSFTGLRIGISAAKGLAVSSDIPCVGVSTLEALALNARHLEGAIVCPLMDARRGEFYNALFRIENNQAKRLIPDRAIRGDLILPEINHAEKLILLGDGAEKFTELFPEYKPFLASPEFRFQSGASVALLGSEFAKEKKTTTANALSPSYLRLPQAEREWLEKNKK